MIKMPDWWYRIRRNLGIDRDGLMQARCGCHPNPSVDDVMKVMMSLGDQRKCPTCGEVMYLRPLTRKEARAYWKAGAREKTA